MRTRRDVLRELAGGDAEAMKSWDGVLKCDGDNCENFALEQCFDIADPELAGVQMCATVRYSQKERLSLNHISFKRGAEEAEVRCVRSVASGEPPASKRYVAMMAKKGIKVVQNPEFRHDEDEELIDEEDATQTTVPPTDHFASLRSYVAGIAEFGLRKLLKASAAPASHAEEMLPLTISPMLERQLVTALGRVAPDFVDDVAMETIAEMPVVNGAPPRGAEHLSLFSRCAKSPKVARLCVNKYPKSSRVLRLLLVEGKNVPEDVMLQAFATRDGSYFRPELLKKEVLPDSVLSLIIDNGYDWEVVRVAKRKNLSAPILHKLSQSRHAAAREVIASNPNLQPADVDATSKDENPSVRAALASRKDALPEYILKQLSSDESPEVRAAIAHRRQKIPAKLVETFANDDDAKVRAAVARRRGITQQILYDLAIDPAAEVRAAVATRGDLPPDVVRWMKTDASWQVRAAYKIVHSDANGDA